MGKINVAQLLKDCPKGMELDCTMYDNLYFNQIYDDGGCLYKIGCYTIVDEIRTTVNFTEFGTFNTHANSKCVIFPKGKTTWKGFQRPFKDGDVLYCDANDDGDDDDSYKYVFILKEIIEDRVIAHCFIRVDKFSPKETYLVDNTYPIRLATEEEKQELFQAIKDNGYEWDPDTKTLNEFKIKKGKWYVCIKKLYGEYDNEIFHKGYTYYSPEDGKLMPSNSNIPYEVLFYEHFREWVSSDAKDGDILAYNSANGISIFIHRNKKGEHTYKTSFYVATDGCDKILVYNKYTLIALNGDSDTRLATEEEKEKLFQAIKENGYKWNDGTKTLERLVVPKFNEGDRIRLKDEYKEPVYKIINIKNDCYITDHGELHFRYEYLWVLVPNKFDITTLKPFDKVLSRDCNTDKWNIDFFSYYGARGGDDYQCMTFTKNQCIPYEGNEHLLGTTNDCDECFKTWK